MSSEEAASDAAEAVARSPAPADAAPSNALGAAPSSADAIPSGTATNAPTHAGKRPATDSGEPGSSEEPSKKSRVEVTLPSEASSSAAAAPAAAVASPSDELIAAAPKLAEAIRSEKKCVKVADKVASILEEGRMLKLSNASAVFDILTAGVEVTHLDLRPPTDTRHPSIVSLAGPDAIA